MITGSLNTAREHHTATLLPNGNVLVAGGIGNRGFATNAELYDPATKVWTVSGPMNVPREFHTATLLPNGKVLVTGGLADTIINSAERYDPASGNWTLTTPMKTARANHTATLLPNGMVLVAGGYGIANVLNRAELYDPVSETWTDAGPLLTARDYHTANLLFTGEVLVAGGEGIGRGANILNATELYTSSNSPVTIIGSINQTMLPDGEFHLAFTSDPNGTNTVLMSTNLASPNWTMLGAAAEFVPGLFQFYAPGATNGLQSFYRIRSP